MADTERLLDVRGRKLMIAIPAYDGKLNIKTAFALANLIPLASRHGVQIMLTHMSGCSIITKARNALVDNFMTSDATDLLFVDADVIINPEAVMRLLALSTNKDVTAGIYPRRGADRKFFLDFFLDNNDKLVFDVNGLMKIKSIGTGFMMIQRHVLETMIERHPEWRYYNNVDNTHHVAVFDFAIENGEYIGEDYLFCRRAEREGFSIYLDPTISLPHIGTQEFERDFMEDALKPVLNSQLT